MAAEAMKTVVDLTIFKKREPWIKDATKDRRRR